MARKLRVEYPGAIYHVMNRGDHREAMQDGMNGPKTNPLAALMEQERRLLAEVAKGKTDKEVAVALGLTTKTARNYLDRIFTKLNVHTRTEAALLFTRFNERNQPWE